ncbi:hypothetical protein GWI33_014439 [Rhynchophorus ferrugineus]|uniref:Uncharacterized protein n=1 Tax=Rhynchophorus ferrugineus TaxID=354439 RepID=A0A834I1E9_RHYFE|nr:hypothetical protein GWI33_014439 [Rhynchophorus ferrugineus]
MDKKEFRVLIKYCFLKGKNTVETKAWQENQLSRIGMLTFDQKQRRVDDSEQCLRMIKRNKPEFLHRYVTMVIGSFEGRNRRKTAVFEEKESAASQSAKRWQKSMNWASNCFLIHRILQIWLPAMTISCSQISKECSLGRDFRRMKR